MTEQNPREYSGENKQINLFLKNPDYVNQEALTEKAVVHG